MPIEILMLAASVGLLLVLTLVQGARNILLLGQPVCAGNQRNTTPWDYWNERLGQAIRQLIEAIAIFAPLVLIIHGMELHNDQSAFGAQLFFVARLAHVVFYMADVGYARVGSWFVGVVGILMTASILFYL